MLNDVIVTKVKVQSINHVSTTNIYSNNLRDNTIWLGAVYVCDGEHDEIIEKYFQGRIKL